MAAKDAWAQGALVSMELQFEHAADPEKAPAMTAYMKGHFPFFGVQAEGVQLVLRSVLEEHGKPTGPQLLTLAQLCWEQPEREFQYGATKLVRRFQKKLTSEDLPVVKRLITTKSWWDTVDELASHVVGGLVTRDPSLLPTMDAWSMDSNMWVARTAILHQLRYKDETDTDRLFTYCRAQMGHKDFFIRKAIGWALRQYGRTDPAAVLAFVEENADHLSGLSKREATKHLR